MSNNQDSSLSCKEYQTSVPLTKSDFHLHTEFGIRNQTGRTLYMMSGSGKVTIIPYVGSYRDESRVDNGIAISYIQRDIGLPDKYNAVRDISIDDNLARVDLFINNSRLHRLGNGGTYIDTPYYVAELGFVISFNSNLDVLKQAHPGFRNSVPTYIASALKRTPQEVPGAAPLYIIANSHNTSINKLYVIINDSVCTVNVGHDFSTNELLDIYVANVSGDVLRYHMLTKAGFVSISEPAKNAFCIWGIDKNAVYKRFVSIKDEKAKLLSVSEVDDRIADALREANEKIAQLEKEASTEHDRNELLVKERDNYKKQVTEINESAKQTHEQEMLQLKAEITKKETEAKRTQLEFEERTRRAEEDAARLKREDDERRRKYEDDVREAKSREERAQREHEDRVRRLEEDLREAKLREEREERLHDERMRQMADEAEKRKNEYDEAIRLSKLQEERDKQLNGVRSSRWAVVDTVVKSLAAIATAGISLYAAMHSSQTVIQQQKADVTTSWIKTIASVASAACSIFTVVKRL